MEKRILGKTGRPVSVVGLGHLAARRGLGRGVRRPDAMAVLDAAAVDPGSRSSTPPTSTATDAASGSSATSWPATPGAEITVATKMGRRVAQDSATTRWRTSARGPTGPGSTWATDRLDLVQLHCPPTPVFSSDAVYDALDTLVAEERIAAYGVSVETCGRGADRDRQAGHRHRADHPQRVPAQAAGSGAARRAAPPGWASSPGSRSPPGCCPAGTPRDTTSPPTTTAPTTGTARRSTSGRRSPAWTSTTGVDAAREFAALGTGRRRQPLAPGRLVGLRWVIQQPGVTTVIPGARNTEQARQNAEAASLPPLQRADLDAIEDLYDKYFRATVHDRW